MKMPKTCLLLILIVLSLIGFSSGTICHAQACDELSGLIENWTNNVKAAEFWHDVSVSAAVFYFSIGEDDHAEEWVTWAEVWYSRITEYAQIAAGYQEFYDLFGCG